MNEQKLRKIAKAQAAAMKTRAAEQGHPFHISVEIASLMLALNGMSKNEQRRFIGPTASAAAEILGVSRQRVYQLVNAGRLQAIELFADDLDDSGKAYTLCVMVSAASIKDYQESSRRPGPKANKGK